MVQLLEMSLPLLAGVLLGIFYFGGLWWTVGRLSRSTHPAGLYLASLGFRLAILLLGFWFLLNVGVVPCMTAFAGFIAARFALVRRLGWSELRTVKSPGSLSADSSPTGSG